MASTVFALLSAFQAFTLQASASSLSLQSGSNTNSDDSDRNAPLQILTDGTQDLAALVGLFATDAVERFSFDHTKGFLAPAVAPLSMLGLLGYVRALLKLSLGREACEKAGFSIEALKSMMGIGGREKGRAQQMIPVFYLKRTVREGFVYWDEVKHVLHDEESMPILRACKYMVQEHHVVVPRSLALLAFSAFLSGFAIMIFDISPSWTRSYATVGLVLSVLVGAAPWSLVYVAECVPIGVSSFFKGAWLSRADQGFLEMLCRYSSKDMSDEYVSLFGLDSQYFVQKCRPITSNTLLAVKAVSFCAAISIGVAYVCQYISLRTTTAEASVVWLAIQAVLAAVRVIVWIWAPARIPILESRVMPVDRTLSTMVSFRDIGGQTNLTISRSDKDDGNFYESFTELEYFICIVTQRFEVGHSLDKEYVSKIHYRHPQEDIKNYIPCWLADRMGSIRFRSAFRAHLRLRDKTATAREIENLKTAVRYFDMPCNAFAKWLELKGRFLLVYDDFLNHQKTLQARAFYTCRIILDRNDSLRMLPGVRRVRPNNFPGSVPFEHVVDYFTYRDVPENNMICFPSLEPKFGQQLLHESHESMSSSKFMAMDGLEAVKKLKWMASRAFLPSQGFFDAEIKEMFKNMRPVIDGLYEEQGT